jgi:hypothetical protein
LLPPRILTNAMQDNNSFVLGLIDGDGVVVSYYKFRLFSLFIEFE